MKTALHNTIMRRIYYAYAIRLVTLPGVLQGVLMLVALIGLTRLVSIKNVLQNLSHVEVGRLGEFAYNTVTHTHLLTLIFCGLIIYSLFSIRFILPTKQVTHQLVKA